MKKTYKLLFLIEKTVEGVGTADGLLRVHFHLLASIELQMKCEKEEKGRTSTGSVKETSWKSSETLSLR